MLSCLSLPARIRMAIQWRGYTRTALTDALHNAFGFCTPKQIVPVKVMRNICSVTKNP